LALHDRESCSLLWRRLNLRVDMLDQPIRALLDSQIEQTVDRCALGAIRLPDGLEQPLKMLITSPIAASRIPVVLMWHAFIVSTSV
jgi:hypothetical protein